jgi:hypothetical protein
MIQPGTVRGRTRPSLPHRRPSPGLSSRALPEHSETLLGNREDVLRSNGGHITVTHVLEGVGFRQEVLDNDVGAAHFGPRRVG